MVGLEVCHFDPVTRDAIVARLRRAEQVTGGEAAVLLKSEPDALHCATSWAREGRHVLLTVDAVASPAELDALTAAVGAGGGRLMLANLERYLPSRQLIKQELEAGKLGVPGLLRVHHWEALPADRAADRGGISAALRRSLDVALWLFRQGPDLIYAIQPDDQTQDAGHHSHVLVHLGFASGGGMALIDEARLPAFASGYDSLTLIGSSGAAYADDHSNCQLWYGHDGLRASPAMEGLRPAVQAIQTFLDHLVAPSGCDDGVDAWRRTLMVADAVESSLATRGTVRPEVA